jgi:hypothetical protein
MTAMDPPRFPNQKKRPGGETVVLIPFLNEDARAGGLCAPATTWKYGKQAVIDFSTSAPDAKAKLGSLVNSDDVLYVYGHGGAGFQGLATRPDKSGKVASAANIIDFLRGKLPEHFSGKVKIFACGTGAAGEDKQDPFAQTMATEMGKIWKQCSFFGYRLKLDDTRVDDRRNLSGDIHNWAQVDKGTGTNSAKDRVRASDERVRIEFRPK